MKISDEQVRQAVEYLQTADESHASPDEEPISQECLERARSVIETTPDVRDDRLDDAREMLAGTGPSSTEVAEKIIGRIISDSIR